MQYREINKIYEEIINLIEKDSKWSEVWIGIIIILPCLICDINTINRTNPKLKDEIKYILDRLPNGFGRINSVEFGKDIIKKFIYKLNSKNYFTPRLIFNKKVKVLIFDSALNLFKERKWEGKNDKDYYFTSVLNFFGSKIKIDENKTNKNIDNISNEIIKIVTQNIDKKNRKKWDKIFQEKFKSKIYNSIKCAIIRFKKFDKIPINCDSVYLTTLYSPFNRIIALSMQRKKIIINSFDHGSGIGNTSNWMNADIEYQLTNNFITFGKDFIPILNEFNMRRKVLLNSEFKIIPSYLLNKNNIANKRNLKIKNIIYLTTMTFSPDTHCLPDPLGISTYTIFKINILKSLSKLKKYNLYIKEHPETKKENCIHKDILKSLDIIQTKKNLEDLKESSNLFIIDYIQTSCLRFALENKIKTILFINNETDTSREIIKQLKKYNFIEIIDIVNTQIPIDPKLIKNKIKNLNKIKKLISGNLYL